MVYYGYRLYCPRISYTLSSSQYFTNTPNIIYTKCIQNIRVQLKFVCVYETNSTCLCILRVIVCRVRRRRDEKSEKDDSNSDCAVFVLCHVCVLRSGIRFDTDVAVLRSGTFSVNHIDYYIT